MTFDHGLLNIPLAKRYGKGGIDAAIDRHLADQRRASAAAEVDRAADRRDARAAEAARTKLTAADVAGAILIRDKYGWHSVVSVNAKSVTVHTAWSWTERIPLDAVLEVRTT